MQIPYNRPIQKPAEGSSRSEPCWERLGNRTLLFLSRATRFTVDQSERRQSSRPTALGHHSAAEAAITAMTSTEIRGEISTLLDPTATTTVGCPLLRGVVSTRPDAMTIGTHMVMSGALGLTRDPFSFRTGSTEADTTVAATTEMFRVAVAQQFQVRSVSAEPSGLRRFPPTSGWQLELASFLASRSPRHG